MTPSPKSPPDAGVSLLRRWGLSWGGWRDNRRGEWWLLAQLLLIAAHLLPPWPAPGSWGYAWPLPLALGGAVLFLVGMGLALQGFLSLGASLSPLPEPIPGAALVTSGAYGRCRHPLYQAVLLCSLGVTLALGSLLHLGLLLALGAVLGGKARREERALASTHPDYAAYRHSTAAIIPRLPWLDWREL
ncbi:isoprenylcysteine carboxylmethyltransferase family protein [Cyanobium sp. LEGE 06113]|uniref:methyltransferase family protein n=1 Tax=Cyanobium sp. LEGE 06113 TaxID=1297573 RepID=UPI0018800348|nr:methyltransferase [Cyanobium sp. LEGE 06113]MBE9152879.1 S-isoprenylcysteine methyltransferase [Cyanobium sp. LEGE 06113]MBE9152916.1 S-isoprenylcysteine methyltransferase [Cyanobium sp. LEGE 06113]